MENHLYLKLGEQRKIIQEDIKEERTVGFLDFNRVSKFFGMFFGTKAEKH